MKEYEYEIHHRSNGMLGGKKGEAITSKEEAIALLEQFPRLDKAHQVQLILEADNKVVPTTWDEKKRIEKIAEYILAGELVIIRSFIQSRSDNSTQSQSVRLHEERKHSLGSEGIGNTVVDNSNNPENNNLQLTTDEPEVVPTIKPGKVTVSREAREYASKSSAEALKQRNLELSAESLSKRGFDVRVEGEGVTGQAGEIILSRKGFGSKVPAENKRLEVNTTRAVQTAIEKGTKQVGDGGTVVIDGTGSGTTLETFEKSLGTFKRTIVPKRIEKGKTGTSGQILFVHGESGEKLIKF